MSCCPRNPWDNGGLSTTEVCGTFTEPVNPDQGQCFPYREKRDCERPAIQRGPCPGEAPVAIDHPGQNPRFRILTGLYDENCLPILDENDAQITTIL